MCPGLAARAARREPRIDLRRAFGIAPEKQALQVVRWRKT